MFATPTGQPLNPNTDYHEWKRLLKTAGLREARLHDARHTAATVLLLLGVPERTVMSVMGWSSTDMADAQEAVEEIRAVLAESLATRPLASAPCRRPRQARSGHRSEPSERNEMSPN